MLIIDWSNFDLSVIDHPDGQVGLIVISDRLLRLTRICGSLMFDTLVLTPVSVVVYTACYNPSSIPLLQSLSLLLLSSPSLQSGFILSLRPVIRDALSDVSEAICHGPTVSVWRLLACHPDAMLTLSH